MKKLLITSLTLTAVVFFGITPLFGQQPGLKNRAMPELQEAARQGESPWPSVPYSGLTQRNSDQLESLSLPVITCSGPSSTIRFNELPTQPVNGLSFGGVTFGFTVGGVPSTDALFDFFGPGSITFIQDPSLEGLAGGTQNPAFFSELTLTFASPTPFLSFGVSLNEVANRTPGFTVSLFDSSLALFATVPVNTSPLITFTEGQFNFSGTPVKQAVITFNPQRVISGIEGPLSTRPRFVLDNLMFCITFDVCLQDDSNGNILQFSSGSGEYQFTNCAGLTVVGKGTVRTRGGIVSLEHTRTDGRVVAETDRVVKRGTAGVQLTSQGRTFTIIDRNTANNTCVCTSVPNGS
jgi:hypothetical protein